MHIVHYCMYWHGPVQLGHDLDGYNVINTLHVLCNVRYAPAPAGTSTIDLSCHTSGSTVPHTCDTRRQHDIVCIWHAHSNDSINMIACHCSLSVEALYSMHSPAAEPCWALPPQVNRRPLRHTLSIQQALSRWRDIVARLRMCARMQ